MASPRVLIISSHVATSDVGGAAQVVALERVGVRTVLVPTVLFGRHPGLGAPGGGPVDLATFEGLLGGIEAAGVFETLSAVITGYFASADQVAAAARAVRTIAAVGPAARLVVDPIMGDRETGLYVREAVACALAAELAPRAWLITPNAWELERLTGRAVVDAPSAVAAARAHGGAVLVSSVDCGGDIGVVYADLACAWLASHARRTNAPKGTGDLLTVRFVAANLEGASAREALETSVRAVADYVDNGSAVVRVEAVT